MTDEPSNERLPTPDDSERTALPDVASSIHQPKARKLQLLSVGPLVLGVFEDEIATIAEWRRPTPLPHAPPAVMGVVSIQGRMLTVLDPLSLFEMTACFGFQSGILVALRGDEQLALAVEAKGATLEVMTEDIQPPSDSGQSALRGVLQHGDQVVSVVEVTGLFPVALRGHERRRRRF